MGYQRFPPPPRPWSWRRPPPPPPPPKPRPPPLPPRRSSASFTRRGRPSSMAPFIREIASDACCADPMVTNAKPRDRPLSRSVATCTSVTSPKSSNARRSESEVASKDRLPTYSRLPMNLLPVSDGSQKKIRQFLRLARAYLPMSHRDRREGTRKNRFHVHVASPESCDASRSRNRKGVGSSAGNVRDRGNLSSACRVAQSLSLLPACPWLSAQGTEVIGDRPTDPSPPAAPDASGFWTSHVARWAG